MQRNTLYFTIIAATNMFSNWRKQRNTWYFTVISATYLFSNCVFSERTCMLISVGQCWWKNPLRIKIVGKCKEILGILQLSLLRTCFPIVYFQSLPSCSSLSNNVDEDIDSEVRLLTKAKKYLVFYSYLCYLLVFQLCIFRAYPHAHLCRTMLTISNQK